jgi:hypothetical protein
MIPIPQLLLDILKQPSTLRSLQLCEWDRLVPWARSTSLLSRVAVIVQAENLGDQIPPEPRRHLQASAIACAHNQRAIRWLIRNVEHALAAVPGKIILLKGAAYLAANLPPARGRFCADVDLLVEFHNLADTEKALHAQGWDVSPIRPLDKKYFRTTLHELPPMTHPRLGGELDVHHNILPSTDTLAVSAAALFFESVPLAPDSRYAVLSPCDMVLHAAAHLFRNGKFEHGLRDLLDLTDLLKHFGSTSGFWERLVLRAEELNLKIPFYWGLRYADRFLAAPIPQSSLDIVHTWRPAWPPLNLMDRIVERAVLPSLCGINNRSRAWSQKALSYYPIPRLSKMASPVFWFKRIPFPKTAGR